MFTSKNILWITFAFCVTTASCNDLYHKIGDSVTLACDMNEVEWKLNNTLLLQQFKSGRQRKGNVDTVIRSQIKGKLLEVKDLKMTDSGEYTCGTYKYMLYVASAHANPSTVMYSSDTKLSCDITGSFIKTFKWISPKPKSLKGKEVTLKSVTSDDKGVWTCQINKGDGKVLIELKVTINVVGPLITEEKVYIAEEGTAVLPCHISPFNGLAITGGSWTRGNSSLVTLMRERGSLQWNKTNVNKKVVFNQEELQTVFNMTLNKVIPADAGVYVCSLVFENGKSLNAELMLTVTKSNRSAPDVGSKEASVITKLKKPVLGVQAWIWIVVGVCFMLLIVLVISIVRVHRRNKQMKREIKKSMRRPRNFCTCDRNRRQPGKSPGKRERPPPLPRHQYSSLNE